MKPAFVNHEKVMSAVGELFKYFKTSDPALQRIIPATILTKNIKVLIEGPPGSGKTTLVTLIGSIFFGNGNVAIANMNESLTPEDVLYRIDAGELVKNGKEIAMARELLTKPVRMLNEITRANQVMQNALLSLLSEGRIVYSDTTFKLPDGITFADYNPAGLGGQKDLDWAFADRFNVKLTVNPTSMTEGIHLLLSMLSNRNTTNLSEEAKQLLTYEEMKEIWDDVEKVEVSSGISVLSELLYQDINNCLYDPNRVSGRYKASCVSGGCHLYGNICSMVERPASFRSLISAMTLAKALAWLDRRPEVSKNNITFAFPYVLSTVVKIKQHDIMQFNDSTLEFFAAKVPELYTSKKKLWNDVASAYITVATGNREALKDLQAYAERDLATYGLVKDITMKEREAINSRIAEYQGGKVYTYRDLLALQNDAINLGIDSQVNGYIGALANAITFNIEPADFGRVSALIEKYEPGFDGKAGTFSGDALTINSTGSTVTIYVRSDLVEEFRRALK